jgi:hypothetical protein
MSTIASLFLPTAIVNRQYAERVLKDISSEQFARKPFQGGKALDLNHPAFNFGHLALYNVRMIGCLGGDTISSALPPSYTELFQKGAACQDDPQGSRYPIMTEISSNFFRTYDRLLPLLQDTADETLLAPHPDENLRSRFGSIGATLNYLLVNHVALHLSQVSAWRRCMGLAAA